MAAEDSPPLRRVRWTLAGLVLVGVAVAGAISGGSEHLRVCAQPSPPSPKSACRPVDLEDPQVVALLSLAGLLLLPDITRIKIGGLVEIERKVTEARAAAEEASAKVEQLRVQINQSIATQAGASSTATFNLGFLPPGTVIPPPERPEQQGMS